MPGGKRNVSEKSRRRRRRRGTKKISKLFFSLKHSLTSFETEGSTFLCLAGGWASDIVAFGLVPPILKNQLFPSFALGPLSSRSFSLSRSLPIQRGSRTAAASEDYQPLISE